LSNAIIGEWLVDCIEIENWPFGSCGTHSRNMSRAFVKEDEREHVPATPSRAPLPDGAVNYVTPRGLRLLRAEKEELEEEFEREKDEAKQAVLRMRLAELVFRLSNARVIDLHAEPPQAVRFGATARMRPLNGPRAGEEWESTLVGVDEADAATDCISFFSPVAQALVGKRAGDAVDVETDEGDVLSFEILSVRYEDRV
jgi:transcription elongation factor GreB